MAHHFWRTSDAQLRLVAITDGVGQVSTVEYAGGDPLKITSVTDPFGRRATLTYNAAGQLETITDVMGLVSRFVYGANDFVTTLSTPYGTTSFRHELSPRAFATSSPTPAATPRGRMKWAGGGSRAAWGGCWPTARRRSSNEPITAPDPS